ncbi:TRAP transporter substrate-binding protein [Rhodovulum euryhalinum]|uniref:TRAP-type C4-dicarboxylate transport system substrate-binding protein n=1 Tax=Rhodovulum euryhalinum TaxID=35805 RepID=A0A4R2KCY5_9RHOB|nr:TRAP transporter substrate-binding protein [Rhodovulum euryhalinum]TCO68086.1 TRAP-type C4-dicarboxylate transport system substrate-binding protein [Rhodovulum euryhalinum]
MRFRYLAKALAIGAVTFWAAGAALAQDHIFKLHHFLGANSPTQTETLEPWARAVEENSGGKVRIEIYPAMTLGGRPPELINQVRDGVVDLIWTVNGYTPGLFPRTEVIELPFVYLNDPGAANLALHEMFETDLKPDYPGVEVMFLHVHAGQAIVMRDAEVRAPADFADRKMRIPTRTGAWVLEALGASPVAMPVPDLPQAMSKGVVDGALIPFEIVPALKLQDQAAYHIELADRTRLGTTSFQMSMNKARWDSLPPEIQQAFRDASGPDWLAELGRIWRGTEEAGVAMAVAAGRTHVTLTEDETAAFRAVLEPVVDRWIDDVSGRGVDGAALVEKARMLIAKHGSM